MAAVSTLVLLLSCFLPPFLLSSVLAAGDGRKMFIVHVQWDAKPSVFQTHDHWYESSLKSLSDGGGVNRMIHTYNNVFHGFSARMSAIEAKKMEFMPGILAVIPEQVRRLETTRSPEFLGLTRTDSAGLLKESDFGSDLVIGVLDTGIWPERRSFSDEDLGPVPAKWKGEGYEATNGKMNESTEYRSPRDSDGHGTHTASIAAGRYVFPASTLGYARGVAAGMAPKARLAAYKVCWISGCYDADILAAFDYAVADGVGVISLSVGGVVDSPLSLLPGLLTFTLRKPKPLKPCTATLNPWQTMAGDYPNARLRRMLLQVKDQAGAVGYEEVGGRVKGESFVPVATTDELWRAIASSGNKLWNTGTMSTTPLLAINRSSKFKATILLAIDQLRSSKLLAV
nr:subtilisin-like protease SBT1.5 [Ipomoea batatas]